MPDDQIHGYVGSLPERAESRPCPICAQAGPFVFQRSDGLFGIHPAMMHPLYHCASCDFYFGSPMPPEVLKDFYPETYYVSNKAGSRVDRDAIYLSNAQALLGLR